MIGETNIWFPFPFSPPLEKEGCASVEQEMRFRRTPLERSLLSIDTILPLFFFFFFLN